MVVQVGPDMWVNPEDVITVLGDGNGFGAVYLRGFRSDGPGIMTGWPVEVVVKSINGGGE